MWRWMNWAVRTLVTAVLLSFLSIWTTGYIVNSYMETLLKQLDLPLQTQPFALSGMWGKLWGADPAGATEAAASPLPTASKEATAQPSASPSASVSQSEPAETQAQASPTAAPEPSDDAAAPEPSDDAAAPVFNAGSGVAEMTAQQRQALNTAMSKLNAIQLAQLTSALEDGLTQEELTLLGESMQPSLSQAEYQQMMELLQSRVDTQKTVVPPAATKPATPSASSPFAREALP